MTVLRVLIVDDEPPIRRFLRTALAAQDYRVEEAADGETALDFLKRNPVDLIVLDLGLPGMDGLALCRAIRRQTYSGYVYIVLHTSKDTDEDMLEGLDAGADDYLCKGTSKAQIIRRLNTAQRILSYERALKSSLEQTTRTATANARPAANLTS